MKRIVSIITVMTLLLSITVFVSPISVSASKTEAPSWISIDNPTAEAEVPYGMPVKALFTTTPRGDLKYVKVLLDGEPVAQLNGGTVVDGKMSEFVEMTEENKKFAVKYATSSKYIFIHELPADKLTPGLHTLGIVAYENGFGEHAPAEVSFFVMDYPEKSMKTKTHGMNLANFGGTVTTTTNNDYTGFPTQASSAAAVSAVAGADASVNENDKAICLGRSEAGTSPTLTFYINGTYSDSNRIKGDRIIFSVDLLIPQDNAAINFEQVLYNASETYFKNDGTIIGGDFKYNTSEWKNFVIDMDYPGKKLILYYDGVKVRTYSMSDTYSTSGTARVKVQLGSSTVAPASICFDNFDVYTVAPYASSVKYTLDSATVDAGLKRLVPCGASSVTMQLTGAFNSDSLNGLLSVKDSNGEVVKDTVVTYDSETSSLTAFLPKGLTAGSYYVEVAQGAAMTETKNTNSTTVTLSDAHSEAFTVYALDSISDFIITITDNSADAKVSITKQPVDSIFGESVTVIAASYNGKRLTAVNSEKRAIANGENEISLSISNLNGSTAVKAFVWDSISGLKPYTFLQNK